MKKAMSYIRVYWSLMVGLALMVLLLTSCRGAKGVPVVHDTIYRNKTEYVNLFHHDSIYMHDSVVVVAIGDTVMVDRWHIKYVERTNTDTIIKADTIIMSKEVPIVVKDKKSRIRRWLFGLVLANLALLCAYLYIDRRN